MRARQRMRKKGGRGGRPPLSRKVGLKPRAVYFKPARVPVGELKITNLSFEELEALRLSDVKGLNQEECAKKMRTSQSTFQRILKNAHSKVSKALIEGRAIRVNEENNI